jgi:hypothetical protein
MEKIEENVFVDAAMDISDRKKFLASIDTARELTRAGFGTLLASPRIIGCSTEDCLQKFGERYPKAKAY